MPSPMLGILRDSLFIFHLGKRPRPMRNSSTGLTERQAMDPRPCVTSIASHSSCRFRVTPSRPCRSEQNFENKQTNKTRVGMVDAGFAFSFLPPCARTRLACRALIGQQRSPAGRHGNGAAANRDAVNDGHLSLSACTRKPRRLHALRSVKDQRRPAPSSGGQTNYVDDNETRWTTPSAR